MLAALHDIWLDALPISPYEKRLTRVDEKEIKSNRSDSRQNRD